MVTFDDFLKIETRMKAEALNSARNVIDLKFNYKGMSTAVHDAVVFLGL